MEILPAISQVYLEPICIHILMIQIEFYAVVGYWLLKQEKDFFWIYNFSSIIVSISKSLSIYGRDSKTYIYIYFKLGIVVNFTNLVNWFLV